MLSAVSFAKHGPTATVLGSERAIQFEHPSTSQLPLFGPSHLPVAPSPSFRCPRAVPMSQIEDPI